ncbi:MAG: anfO [Herbinix sp.]|jgi:Fe-only nitrogenase accessory protein AnfO|nr:anfO [Herbinix sp.]
MQLIAVFVNDEGNAASLVENGFLRLYTKGAKEWIVKSELPFLLDNRKGLIEVRTFIQQLVKRLDGCTVFVAQQVAGQLYYILEANGFNTYEAEGKPEQFLDSIWEDLQLETARITETVMNLDDNKTRKVERYPIQTEKEGVYYFNLKQALLADCSLTSKKILIPFLRQRHFQALEIICDHVPQWIASELISLELTSTVTLLEENEYKVSIKRIRY